LSFLIVAGDRDGENIKAESDPLGFFVSKNPEQRKVEGRPLS
jgi:hypothetical protein